MCEITAIIDQLQVARAKEDRLKKVKLTVENAILIQALIEDIAKDGRWNEKANVEGALYFCRVDHISGDLMTEGWCLFNGEYFFANEEDAEAAVRESGYRDIEHADDETLGTQWCEWWGGTEFEARVEELKARYLTKA